MHCPPSLFRPSDLGCHGSQPQLLEKSNLSSILVYSTNNKPCTLPFQDNVFVDIAVSNMAGNNIIPIPCNKLPDPLNLLTVCCADHVTLD